MKNVTEGLITAAWLVKKEKLERDLSMKKLTSYQRLKEKNRKLKSLFDLEFKRFLFSKKDFQKRLDYIKKCINNYRK